MLHAILENTKWSLSQRNQFDLISVHFRFMLMWKFNGTVFKPPIGNLCRNINHQIYSSLAMATKTVTTCSAELLRGALANYKKWWRIYLCFKTYNRFLFFSKTEKPFKQKKENHTDTLKLWIYVKVRFAS